MQYRQLGNSDLKVSLLCLGTMTWGVQNSEREAFAQLDYAWSRGINFLDTAEMYPIPTGPKHQGETERIIGRWMQERGNRDRVVLATKVTGPGAFVSYIREDMRLDRRNIRAALEGSLKRLQTDYVDLYQVHWPDRVSTFFGKRGYEHRPEEDGASLEETLEALAELVQEGKVRAIGVSNETPWGVMRYLGLAEARGLPRVATVQNPYSLLNRSCETGLAEVLLREDIGLLPYSPLAFGTLSGKYLHDQRPPNARLTLFPDYLRYLKPAGIAATEAYVALAHERGLDPAQMALAYVNSRPFVTSNIIGATTLAQLKSNIDSEGVKLDDGVLEAIEAIHENHPNPCP
ncbi:NADP(H)-dependent aldo-keto reductase [Motiliproteus sp. SC1-56]|uniref:NADP(H)-dependent aldo-keto reductase n=1 Tax=Motiliproteus sp. SC1-56 TaxID=2799565 RepID=UPI001A8EDBAA|nr:NADP(H)-dependent aldo-keto reductase [Motiliproteus sp. SC1-56]